MLTFSFFVLNPPLILYMNTKQKKIFQSKKKKREKSFFILIKFPRINKTTSFALFIIRIKKDVTE